MSSNASKGAGFGTFVSPGLGTVLGYSAGLMKDGLDAEEKARKATEKLEQDRRDELANQERLRAAARDRAAKRGATVGLTTVFGNAFGYGTGNTSAGVGLSTLFGN